MTRVSNQEALSALKAVTRPPDPNTTDRMLETASNIREAGKDSVMVSWSAGHVGLAGNEEVDREVKKGAEGPTSIKKV